MNLSDFRIAICYSSLGYYEDYKIFSNPEAANEFRDFYKKSMVLSVMFVLVPLTFMTL